MCGVVWRPSDVLVPKLSLQSFEISWVFRLELNRMAEVLICREKIHIAFC